MSALYASIASDSAKTEATRRGHKRISTHTRGWTVGVRVEGHLNANGAVVFDVFGTAGSNPDVSDVLLGCVVRTKDGPQFRPAEGGGR